MLTKEQVLAYGPRYLELLDYNDLTVSFDYESTGADLTSLPKGETLVARKYVIDYGNFDPKSDTVPLDYIEEYAVKETSEQKWYYSKNKKVGSKETTFQELVENYPDRLYLSRHSMRDLEGFDKL